MTPQWPHREARAPGASDDPSVAGEQGDDEAGPGVGDDPVDDDGAGSRDEADAAGDPE